MKSIEKRAATHDAVTDYGLRAWSLAQGRPPRFHRDTPIPSTSFEPFGPGDEASHQKVIESSLALVREERSQRTQISERATLTQRSLLRHVATIYSLATWVQTNCRLPSLSGRDPVERSMAVSIEATRRRRVEFSKLKDRERDPELAKSADQLAKKGAKEYERLRSVLCGALRGYTQHELDDFNRYYFVTQRLRSFTEPHGTRRITDEQWAYILGGQRDARQLRTLIDRFALLAAEGQLRFDASKERYVPHDELDDVSDSI